MQTANYEQNPGYATRWIAMIFIGISLLVISLDNTILNVAIPSIATDLKASASELQWIVDAYVLVFASLMLTMGTLGDRLGRKQLLQIGLILFGIGSTAAALSTSTNMLIASRAFLGIGGAIIMPATLSIISATFPREERAQAIAIWAGVFSLGVGLGPLAGGFLIEHFDWSAVFFINLPVVAVALAGGYVFITESKDPDAPQIDLPGILLSIVGLFALVYGIIKAGEASWTDSYALAAFAAAAVLLTIFAWWENRSPNAMLPFQFFRNMSFTGANLTLIMVMFCMFGASFFLSQYMQSVLGYTALETGVRLVPMALTSLICAVLSAKIADQLGTKLTVVIGVFVAGLALVYFSQTMTVASDYYEILIGLVLFAGGIGLTMSPATNSIMQSVPVEKAGVGSAMNDTTRQLGGALGVAVLGTIMNNIYRDTVASLHPLLENALPEAGQAIAGINSSIQSAHITAAHVAQAPGGADLAQLITQTTNQAFVDGMNEAILVAAGIMFFASVLALVILPTRVKLPESTVQAQDAELLAVSGTD